MRHQVQYKSMLTHDVCIECLKKGECLESIKNGTYVSRNKKKLYKNLSTFLFRQTDT